MKVHDAWIIPQRSIVIPPIKHGKNGPGPPNLHDATRKFQKNVGQVWKITIFDRYSCTVQLCESKLFFSGSCLIEVLRPDLESPRLQDHKSGLKFTRRPREHCQNMYSNYSNYSNYFKFVWESQYKNQTSEKRYKVPTTALPPMRDLGSLYFLNRHTFVCGTLFQGIKLN
jgi:hypothetical protein